MPNQYTLADLGITASIIPLLAIGATPVYLMGARAAEEAFNAALPAILNGGSCALMTFLFAFPFTYNEIKTIPLEWKIANNYERCFLLILMLVTFYATGIMNSYFMIGNPALKIIALIMPGFAGKSIVGDWLLRLHVSFRALFDEQYTNTRAL